MRVGEVFRHSSELNGKLIAALEAICDSVCPELVPVPFQAIRLDVLRNNTERNK
jgi:hypothetical protein